MTGKVMRQFLAEHWGKVLGGLLGLIIGLSIILFGFWQSVLLFLCIILGVYLGKTFDRHEGLQKFLQRVWPDSD